MDKGGREIKPDAEMGCAFLNRGCQHPNRAVCNIAHRDSGLQFTAQPVSSYADLESSPEAHTFCTTKLQGGGQPPALTPVAGMDCMEKIFDLLPGSSQSQAGTPKTVERQHVKKMESKKDCCCQLKVRRDVKTLYTQLQFRQDTNISQSTLSTGWLL